MKKIIFWLIVPFQIILVSVLLPFLPDKVPMHSNLIGQIDRWGSKYELFVIVALTLICLAILYSIVYHSEKKIVEGKLGTKEIQEIKQQVNIMLYSGIGFGILMTFFILYYVSKAVAIKESIDTDINTSQLLGFLLGSIFLLLGILFLFLKKNNVIGIRTKWSMKNELTWKYSHRYSAVVFGIAGVVNILISYLWNEKYLLLIILSVVTAACILCIWITKKMYDRYGK